MRVGSHGNPKCARQTKVGEFEIIILVDQKVLRLEITVENTMRVTVQEASIELPEKFLEIDVSTIET